MKKTKRFLAVLLAAASLMTGAAVLPASATIKNEPFGFTVYVGDNNAAYTASNVKENATSVYIKNTTADKTLRVKTEGFRANVWYNETKNSYANVPQGEYFIYNTIYEKVKASSQARLNITAIAGSFFAKGEWSPDSVGNYPVVNP